MSRPSPPIRVAMTAAMLMLGLPGARPIQARSATMRDTSPPIAFLEVTAKAGITRRCPTYGASFGDLDGNGRPDLWVSNHGAMPSLYLNLGSGLLVDVGPQAILTNPAGDNHGAAWADMDGDGDEDLVQLVGASQGSGQGPNKAFRQDHLLLTDVARSLGLQLSLGRGRTPLWLDWDEDGDLDLVTSHFARADGLAPSTLLLQVGQVPGRTSQERHFLEPWPHRGLGLTGNQSFAQLADLSGDGQLDLVVHGFPYPAAVFRVGSAPPQDLAPGLGLPGTGNVTDAVLADLDGDLACDLFLATGAPESEAVLSDPQTLEASLLVNGTEEGVRVEVGGKVSLSLGPAWFLPLSQIFIGSAGLQPPSRSFVLDPADPSTHGLLAHAPGKDAGVYVGYDPTGKVWQVLHSWPTWNQVNLVLIAGQPVVSVTPVGFDPTKPPPADRLLVRRGRSFLDVTVAAGLGAGSQSTSAVGGDFDNDGDLDLYVVRTGTVQNQPNLLLENDGAGHFRAVPQAGGAPGSTDGRGEVVVTADVDGDGFLDLFLTNGQGDPVFSQDGPHQLYLNLGNRNHWLALDLVGVRSNPHGIGARVLVTAGGRTWVREQGGGMHRHAQDHRRLHFGLGQRTQVERVEIHWPNGLVQVLRNVPADQCLTVREPLDPPFGPGRLRR